MKTDEEFKTFYESELVQKAVLLEGLRLRTKFVLVPYYILAYGILSCSIILSSWILYKLASLGDHISSGSVRRSDDPVIFLGHVQVTFNVDTVIKLALFNLCMFVFVTVIKRGYRLSFRKNIVVPLINFFDSGLDYKPEKEFNGMAIKLSGLFNNVGVTTTRDCMEGSIDKTEVQMTVLDLGRSVGREEDAFKGLLLLTPLNAAPKEDKIMVYSWQHDEVYVDLYQKDTMTLKPEDYGTDSFKKEFTTFTTNRALLAGVLTPAIMDWMLQVKAQASDRICFSFTHHNIFMAFHCESIFEPAINRPVKEEDVFLWAKTFHVALQAITSFEAIKPHVHA